jgi:hypothetical protein
MGRGTKIFLIVRTGFPPERRSSAEEYALNKKSRSAGFKRFVSLE